MPASIFAGLAVADVALVLPGFSREFQRQAIRLPALERLLGYGRGGLQVTRASRELDAWQCEVLTALRIDEAARYASAPLTWLGAGGAMEAGTLLHAQPVSLAVSSQGLTLQSVEEWSAEKLSAVERNVREHLLALNMSWHVRAGAAFVLSEKQIEAQTVSANRAFKENLHDALPTGTDAVVLRRLMTDLQMLLHDKPTANFNSLWLWGNGFLPTATNKPLPTLWSNDAYVRGVYAVHDARDRCADLPSTADEVVNRGGGAMIVARDADLPRLERHWLAPLVRALDRGAIRTIEVYLDGSYARLERSWFRRWLLRPRSLTELPA